MLLAHQHPVHVGEPTLSGSTHADSLSVRRHANGDLSPRSTLARKVRLTRTIASISALGPAIEGGHLAGFVTPANVFAALQPGLAGLLHAQPNGSFHLNRVRVIDVA